MPVVVFEDHLVGLRAHLRNAHRARDSTALLKLFLEKSYVALRDEVSALSRESRADLPTFNSVFDLCERHESLKTKRLDVSSALLCVCQLAHFIGHYEQQPHQYPTLDSDVIIGLGIGQLSSAAVACSKTVVDLVPTAVEAVRLAFRVGAVVGQSSLHSTRSKDADAGWSMIVRGSVESISKELNGLQDRLNVPTTDRVYISAVGQDACTVSGRPSRLQQILRESQVMRDGCVLELPTVGLWHAEHVYGEDFISQIVKPRASALDRVPELCQLLLSPRTGEVVESESGKVLFEQSVRDILQYPIQWATVQNKIVRLASFYRIAADHVLSFEASHVTKSLLLVLESGIGRTVASRDITAWFSGASKAALETESAAMNIAIVGMSGRFPGAPDVEALWKLLEQGRDMHQRIPEDRFNVDTHYDASGKKNNTSHTPYGCFIEEPGLFDARFFNMSPREAAQTDPMHRLALVTAYEALEMSGFVLNRTSSSQADRVGTFFGQTSDDWREVNAAQEIGTYFIPGGVRAFAPGRISYYFGFRGPSYSVDTACSSSLAALQVACTSIKAGECDTAIVGGLNVLTAPDIFAGLSRGQFLSKTGACKTWDSKADGYCRADGVGTIVIKRLENAVADKDNILGVILSSATNHSADAISITHPHAGNQSYLYSSVLHTAGVNPLDISYVEMHGTGTQAGDLTEIRSVTDVFAPERNGRRADQVLHIGAIKSNVGHSEAAAGITALIKILLMMKKNTIPQHVGIKNGLNPGFPNLGARNVRIPFENTSWTPSANGKPRLAFLNNFSAAGGNTAMLLQAPAQPAITYEVDPRSVLPIVVSAKSISSLQNNIKQLVAYIDSSSKASLGSLSYVLTSRRIHHSYRVALSATDLESARSALLSKLEEGKFTPVSSKLPKVAFTFTGQGAFYVTLGKQLFEESKQFRSEIQHLDAIATKQGWPTFLTAIEGTAEDLSPTVVQIALVCVQIALVKLWKSWGIQPVAVVGHSLGEYAALNAAGVLSADDTINLVGQRAKLLEERCSAGSHVMLAVKASVDDIKLAASGLSFEIACMNAPNDTTISGQKNQIESLKQALELAGYKCVILNLPFAFHSTQIDPILEDFENLAHGASYNKPETAVISPLLGKVIRENGVVNPAYLRRHAREAVGFFEAIEDAVTEGVIDEKTIFLEIGSHPVCSAMVKSTLGSNVSTVSSLHKTEAPWKTISRSLCTLHCIGLDIDWRQFHQDYEASHEFLEIPLYSFDNKNYWINYENDWCLHKLEPRNVPAIEAPPSAIHVAPKLSTTSIHRIVSEEFKDGVGKVVAQSDMSEPALRAAVLGHLVNGAGLCPSSIYADMAFTLGDYIYKQLNPDAKKVGLNCGEMEVVKPLIVKTGASVSQVLQVTITADMSKKIAQLRYASINGSGKETVLHATCTVAFEESTHWIKDWSSRSYLIEGRIETLKDRLTKNKANQISRGLAYKLFGALVQYDEKYQGMEEIILDSSNYEATSRVNFQTKEKDGNFFCSPFWIDSLAHISGFILNGSDAVDSMNFVYISHGWGSMRLGRQLDRNTTYNAYVKMQPAGTNMMAGDVYILQDGEIIGVVGALKFQCIPRKILNTVLPPDNNNSVTVSRPAAAKPIPVVSKREEAPVVNKLRKAAAKVKSSRPPAASVSRQLQVPMSQGPSIINQAINIIAQEAGLPLSEIQDDIAFTNLGVDSLLSLQIAGKFREDLDLEIPSSVFIEYPTPAELRTYLQQFDAPSRSSISSTPFASSDGDDNGEDSDTSVSSISSVPSIKTAKAQSTVKAVVNSTPSTKSGDKKTETMELFRSIIAEQMGIAIEELTQSADLISLGLDSLMSICILGIIREQTDLTLPGDLFFDHPTLDAIEKFLGFDAPKVPTKPVRSTVVKRSTKKIVRLEDAFLPQAVSILMQGKPKTATKMFFLFPDGSGSATSYASIPNIDPSVCVYGLNCPFMTTPEDYTNGIDGVATQFLAEVQRRQPHGPYYLGGWSAGGVVAYEVTQQLLARGERVEKLVLFDSPCPIKLEPLPSRLHHFFAEVGLLGGDGPEPPSWLLPHFESSIKALTAYEPAPIANPARDAPETLAIWAQHGVCRYPDDPRPPPSKDDSKSMKWLLENRTDFGPNGWERLLGSAAIKTTSLEGNHFTMMKGADQLRRISELIRTFL